jgi:hypothetical protein
MLGMVLLYVGAVLCLNGLWLLGRIGDNEIAVIDIFVGGLTLLVSLYLAFAPRSNPANIKAAALTLLFTFTYIWVAINRYVSSRAMMSATLVACLGKGGGDAAHSCKTSGGYDAWWTRAFLGGRCSILQRPLGLG